MGSCECVHVVASNLCSVKLYRSDGLSSVIDSDELVSSYMSKIYVARK